MKGVLTVPITFDRVNKKGVYAFDPEQEVVFLPDKKVTVSILIEQGETWKCEIDFNRRETATDVPGHGKVDALITRTGITQFTQVDQSG